MENRQERLSLVSAIALNRIFGNEPKLSNKLIETYGSTEAVFRLPTEELSVILGNNTGYASKLNDYSLEDAEKELDRLSSQGYKFLSIADPLYPKTLKECDDAPILLYVRSEESLEKLFRRSCISIVGTRDMSLYGREYCIKIVQALSQAPSKAIIVSGLAIGVDITAHLSAMDCGLPTIAVSPVGIDEIYPSRHKDMASRIASSEESAIISDFPPHTATLPSNFLRRNRIIAGLSEATILIESKERGGGMMTARLASNYGRQVFALPGRIDDLRSQGCNELIAINIAAPIHSLQKLPESLGLGKYMLSRRQDLLKAVRERFKGRMGENEIEILATMTQLIKKCRGISCEELADAGKMSYSEVLRKAGLLESEDFISIDVLQRCSINTKKLF